MSAVDRRRRPALVAAAVLPAAAAAGLVLLAASDRTAAPGSAPTTPPASTPTAPVDSAPAGSAPVDSAPVESSPTTTVVGFADANEARTAAEGLIPSYIDSQFQHDVTDAACSKPASGDAGQQFVCYALKPGDLVIALRATIGDERLIDLTLITDQQATTTTSTVAVAATTG